MTLLSNCHPFVTSELNVKKTTGNEACWLEGRRTQQTVACVVHWSAPLRKPERSIVTPSSAPYRPSRHAKSKVLERDQFLWRARISEVLRSGQCTEALRMYTDMRNLGITPCSYTFVAVLKACSRLLDLKSARQIHADVLECGFELDVYVGTMLVHVYAKCGRLTDARIMFDKMDCRDLVSWNAMISGYAQVGRGQDALQLYSMMQQEGMAPDDRTIVSALMACSSLLTLEGHGSDGGAVKQDCLEHVRAIHLQVIELGCEKSKYVGAMLVDVYAKCGRLSQARRIFEAMPNRDVVCWTAMILGYAHSAQAGEAMRLFTQMQDEGVVPNHRTFVGALKACSTLAIVDESYVGDGFSMKVWYVQQVKAIHLLVRKSGCGLDVFVGTMLVDAYAKCGSLVDARRVFERMSRRDAASWNAMILGYAQMGEGDSALDLYVRMEQEGVAPNDCTFVAALKACGVALGLEKGKEIHGLLRERKVEDSGLFVHNALIDMYGKCGSVELAQQLFDSLPARDLVTWSALIAGYACQGQNDAVFDSFEGMMQDGIQPDGVTFLSVLGVCSHVGLVNKGLMYFELMTRGHGIRPSIEHYNCLIDLLGRAGQLSTALEIVKAIPFKPSGKMWRSLLGACRKWRNVKMGKHAFDCAVKLDENDAALYVLMANIYATAGMMKDAKEIQEMRVKATGVWRKPGQSGWSDMNGSVHAFLAGDQQHSGSEYVHLMLHDISVKLGEHACLVSPPRTIGDVAHSRSC